jgi:phasin family protein
MAEKRSRRGTPVPFVNAAAAEAEAAPAIIADVPDADAPHFDPATFAADSPQTDTAIAAVADTAETNVVLAEPAPALVAEAPVPMVAAAAIPEAAEPAPAIIETAFVPTPPPALAPAALPSKGLFKMATAPEMTYATADKFQAMFGDVNERAKSAVEKTSKMAEELTELTKGNVEAIVASGRVAAKGAEAMTQEAAEYSKKSFESATGALKSFAAVKSPTELFQLQSEFAKTSFDSMVAEASKVSESMLKLMGEIAQPLSSRYAIAADKLKASVTL